MVCASGNQRRRDMSNPLEKTEHDPAIRIVPYDPIWPEAFAAEAENIRDALGDVAINVYHVGSTAVPGLRSKPIVDILVTVRDIASLNPYRVPLERIGYAFTYDSEFPDFHFFGKPQERPRRYHIHVCQENSVHERRQLAVRDYLRTYSEEVANYESIKARIAGEFPGHRQRYMEAKTLVLRILNGEP